MVNNPYNYGMPVSGEKFVGRWEQVEEMADDLSNPDGLSQMLVGGRRFGKSSLLETLQRRLIEQLVDTEPGTWYVFPVLVDLKSLPQSSFSPEGIFALMLHKFWEYFTSSLQRRKVGLSLEFDMSQTQLAAFKQSQKTTCTLEQFSDIIENVINAFLTTYGLLRLVFLLDEVDVILDKDWTKNLFDNVRSLIYADKVRDNVRCVLAGSSQIVEVREEGSPLLNILKVVKLNVIDDDEIKKIIHCADNVPEDFEQAVLEQCGGHPFLARYIMYYSWDSLQQGTSPVLSTIVNRFRAERRNDLEGWCADVGEAGLAAYKVLSEADTWLTQPEIEQAIQDKQLLPKVGLALYNLCYHGLVLHDGSWMRYHVTGRLFQNWFADEKLPFLKTSIAPPSTQSPQASFLDCQPVIAFEITPIYPTAYWHLMKKERFPLITLVIDNTCRCCTNARFTIKATIHGYSHPDSDTFDVPSGSIERKPLLPRLLRKEVLLSLTAGDTAPCHILVERHTEHGLIPIYDRTSDIEMQTIDTALLAMPNERRELEDVADYLAVFVTPQRQEVKNFVGDATDEHPDGAFDGYQAEAVNAGNVDEIRRALQAQARAFFDALIKADLRYVFSPIIYGGQSGQITQRIRFPFQVLPNTPDHVGQFSCLDLAFLFASLLENIGMEPILVLFRESPQASGHAFVGWHIWKDGKISDFLDITMISQERIKFAEALAEGNRLHQEAIRRKLSERRLFDSNGFIRIIDIASCRKQGIRAFT
jgi:hypothetical protein